MKYEDSLDLINNDKFCDPVKSPNLAFDLSVLKTEVIPSLLQRISELEIALHREVENVFKKDNELEFKI